MNRRFKFIFTLIIIFACPIGYSYGAELIWSEINDEGSAIYRSVYQNKSLVKKITVVQDSNLNIVPAISTSKDGSTMIVWSRITSQGSVLHYIITPTQGSEIRGTFKTDFATNLAPVVVHDNNNIPWLFWSANNGKKDNIFFSRFISQKWQKPTQVNAENNSPDILPEAGMTEDGTIWVTWQQLNNNSYIQLTKTYKNIENVSNNDFQQSNETIASAINRLSSEPTEEISIPTEINTNGRIIYFSRNGNSSYNKSVKSK